MSCDSARTSVGNGRVHERGVGDAAGVRAEGHDGEGVVGAVRREGTPHRRAQAHHAAQRGGHAHRPAPVDACAAHRVVKLLRQNVGRRPTMPHSTEGTRTDLPPSMPAQRTGLWCCCWQQGRQQRAFLQQCMKVGMSRPPAQ